MKNVNYKGLRKFEIGKINTNPGYQVNKNIVNTGLFNSQLGYDMSGDVKAALNSFLPTVMTGLGNAGNVAMNFALNYTTEAAAKAAQAAGNTAVKAGMNTLGKVAGIAGALYGTGSMIKDFTDFSDRLSANDMLNMASTSTQSRHGVNYQTYDGFNAQLIMDYTNAQNKSGVWSSTLNGLSAGSSLGSIWGPWGLAIGGVSGALTGLFGGLFGSDRRRRKVKDTMNHTSDMFQAYNTQAESAAGSKGYRIEFNLAHGGDNSMGADDGKRPGESLSGGKYGVIQTPSGPAYGEIQGLASPDEGMIDMVTGETKYLGSKNMNVKDIRKDIIPVGIRGTFDAGTSTAFTERIGIPGHGVKDEFGLTPADYARPLFKRNDQLTDNMAFIDAKIEENNNHKTRDKATSKYIANKLGKMKDLMQQERLLISQLIANIVDSQTQALNGNMFNCGKTPRYWDGKNWFSEYMKPITLNKPTSWRSATKYPSLSNDMTFNVPTVDDIRKEIFKGPRSVPKYNLDFVKDAKPIKLGDVPEPDDVELEFEKPKTETPTTRPGEVFNSLFGVTDAGVGPGWSVLQGLPYAIGESIAANTHTPYAQNSFVSNATAPAALNVMRSLRYDPYQQIRQLTSARRLNQYNINNAASLSAGQRAALASSNNIQLAQAANAIYDKQQEVNNALATQYATELFKYGQDEASRLQQANAYQQEAYRQAVGAKQKLQAQARKNWYTLGRQALQDYNTMLNTRGMMNLWNAQLAGDGNTFNTPENLQATTTKTTKKIRQKPVISKSDMTALPGETVADTLRKNNRMSYAQVAKIAAKKNIPANSAWRHYMKYGNLNNL